MSGDSRFARNPQPRNAQTPASQSDIDLSFFKIFVLSASGSLSGALPNLYRMLSESELSVKIMDSISEMHTALDGERFDLVIVDGSTSTQKVVQALHEIRAAEGSYRNIPVLAVVQTLADVAIVKQAGVNDSILVSATLKDLQIKFQQWARQIFEALPVLQESSIDKIRMFDDEEHSLLSSLFQIYSESTRDELVQIEQLVKERDFDLLRKKAHKLKSSAAQLGAFRFEKYCNLMEYDADLDQERAQKLYEQMAAEYAKSLTEFSAYCERYSSQSTSV